MTDVVGEVTRRTSAPAQPADGPVSPAEPTAAHVPVIDAAEASEWDRRTIEAGVPSRVLMESAGRGAAHVLATMMPQALQEGVLLVAGQGNNGGDGWVMARALATAGYRVAAIEVGRERSPDCEANRTLALDAGTTLVREDRPRAGVIIDALLGTGASGAPRGEVGRLAETVAQHGAPVVSVDGPTGLDLSTGEAHGPIRATLTISFGGLRRGHLLAREWCGRVVVLDIGFLSPDDGWPRFVDDQFVAARVPPFDSSMHKGNRGRVLIVGGEAGMAGAVHHAARAALGGGAGLVRVAAAGPSVEALQASLPDVTATSTSLAGRLEASLVDMIAWADAIAIGPGLGRGSDRTALVEAVLEAAGTKPCVLDADGLRAGVTTLTATRGVRVLTPHVGEFRAVFPELTDQLAADRFAAAQRAARSWGSSLGSNGVVLLKGVPTVIADGSGRMLVVARGNPGLATGGSGDLLTGLVATLLASGVPAADAAGVGAQVLGRAAEIAAVGRGARAMRPGDVVDALSVYWRSLSAIPGSRLPIMVDLPAPALR